MAANEGIDVDLAARVEQLTAKQRACLELVTDHATSKEIARRLGISRHTVDARLRAANQTLGVTSRREAAIIYRAAIEAESYQPFTYQSPQVVDPGLNPSGSGHGDEPENLHPAQTERPMATSAADARQTAAGSEDWTPPLHSLQRPRTVGESANQLADSAAWTFGAALPAPDTSPRFRLWGGSNDLTPAQRVTGVIVVTMLAMLAFGTFLSGIEALTLLRS